jgi:hypothetical protein
VEVDRQVYAQRRVRAIVTVAMALGALAVIGVLSSIPSEPDGGGQQVALQTPSADAILAKQRREERVRREAAAAAAARQRATERRRARARAKERAAAAAQQQQQQAAAPAPAAPSTPAPQAQPANTTPPATPAPQRQGGFDPRFYNKR